jgi:hypothetical protein
LLKRNCRRSQTDLPAIALPLATISGKPCVALEIDPALIGSFNRFCRSIATAGMRWSCVVGNVKGKGSAANCCIAMVDGRVYLVEKPSRSRPLRRPPYRRLWFVCKTVLDRERALRAILWNEIESSVEILMDA